MNYIIFIIIFSFSSLAIKATDFATRFPDFSIIKLGSNIQCTNIKVDERGYIRNHLPYEKLFFNNRKICHLSDKQIPAEVLEHIISYIESPLITFKEYLENNICLCYKLYIHPNICEKYNLIQDRCKSNLPYNYTNALLNIINPKDSYYQQCNHNRDNGKRCQCYNYANIDLFFVNIYHVIANTLLNQIGLQCTKNHLNLYEDKSPNFRNYYRSVFTSLLEIIDNTSNVKKMKDLIKNDGFCLSESNTLHPCNRNTTKQNSIILYQTITLSNFKQGLFDHYNRYCERVSRIYNNGTCIQSYKREIKPCTDCPASSGIVQFFFKPQTPTFIQAYAKIPAPEPIDPAVPIHNSRLLLLFKHMQKYLHQNQ